MQAQKYRNWSKFPLKLQKKPKHSLIGARQNFLEFLKSKNRRRTPKQQI
jgi:hypothetical protein